MHHIATDGWSMNIIQNDIAALYQAQGEVSKVQRVGVNYAAYARWQQAGLKSPSHNEHLEYWQLQLAGIEPMLLPADYPRPAIQVKYNGCPYVFP